MPSFSFQVSIDPKDDQGQPLLGVDGKPVHVPPQAALQLAGPLIQIALGLSISVAKQLVQQGLPVPDLKTGYALIDTGATSTCVDEAVAQSMRLPVIDRGKMNSASHEAQECNVYPIQLTFTGAAPISLEVPRAMGANLAASGIIALIGRDFLQHGTMFYSGFDGRVTISI